MNVLLSLFSMASLSGVLYRCLVCLNNLMQPPSPFERQDELYSYEENGRARSQGFAVHVKLSQKNVQWCGREYTRESLSQALRAEVTHKGLSRYAVNRSPFVVDVEDGVKCGHLLELFDEAEGLGFVVKGFNSLHDAPSILDTPMNGNVTLPQFRNGLPFSSEIGESFACVITLVADDVYMMDGVTYSCAIGKSSDALYFAVKEKCRSFKAQHPMGTPARALFYVDVNVSAHDLYEVMVQCFNAGIRSFHAIGRSESDQTSQRYIRFDLPLPNGFYWGAGDLERKGFVTSIYEMMRADLQESRVFTGSTLEAYGVASSLFGEKSSSCIF